MTPITKLLITTALDATWGSQQNIIFLGEWCKKYSMKNLWQSREHETLDYHWRDRSKLAKDHHYLESLNEEVLLAMTLFLNKFHGVEKSARYWRIIIGPWLLSYISVLWDRWEAVSRAIELDDELETFVLEKALKRTTPDDFVSFRAALDSDGWNHGIFADILMERSPSNIKTITLNNPLPVEVILPQLKLTLLQKLFPILARLAESFIKRVTSKSQKVLFFHSYFPRKHQQREIPGNYLAYWSYSQVFRELDFQNLRPACVMIKVTDYERNVDVTGFANRFSVIHSFKDSK